MNLLSASAFNNLFDSIFADWAVALFIFFAVLILLAVLFKGLKVGITLLIIVAVLAGIGALAAFVFMLITWDILRIIDFAVKWGPTILFVTIITISTLVNAKRGLRKSLILLAQAVGACVVCTIFYYVCINNAELIDKVLLDSANLVLGRGGFQKILGVSEQCSTLREVLAEWLPNILGGDMKILLAANPQYIITLVDMAFRIIIAVLSFITYFILVFILYVIYFFGYPERRYKKKVNREVTHNFRDRTYKKHHIGGGVVGLVRGITVGLLSLSFIGSAFFMVAGGLGQGVMGDYDLDNDDYNFYYSIYRSIESYGSQGIFKVLNTMTDSSDTPFYLFAADMVLSGNLDDEENDIHDKNIKFREEIAAYTGFARDTLSLLMKYGEDDIVNIINGRGGDGAFDTVVNIMTIPEFRAEFDGLIKEFDAQTYVINFGMSLITTIVNNIDDVSFTSPIGEEYRELLKILFKKGHLSDAIPDELKLKQDIEAGIISPDKVAARPRLKVSHLLNKDDVRIALEVAFSILAGEQDTKDTLGLVKALLPEVKQLSILKTSRAAEVDPVLARLYCFYGNKYLTAEDEEGITYAEVVGKKIKWLDELNLLLDVAGDAISFWNNIYDEKSAALDMLVWAFDEENPDRIDNEIYFDNVCAALEKSELIGLAMSTSYMNKMLKLSLVDLSKNVYIPENIQYNNTVNADGSVTYGELHQFFCGFRILVSPEYRGILDKIVALTGNKEEEIDIKALLEDLAKALPAEDKYGKTLSYYLTESELLRSAVSSALIENDNDLVYIPTASLDTLEDGTPVNVINKVELKQLFDHISLLVEFFTPIEDGESKSDYIGRLEGYLYNGEFALLLEQNRIVEGTAAKLLSKYIIENEFIVVPAHLVDDFNGWVTVNGRKGELRSLLDALLAVDIDLAKIAEGEFNTSDLFDMLLDLDANKVEDLLSSQILHYTLSKYIIDGTDTVGFKLIVPNGARERTAENDTLEYIIRKSELVKLFAIVAKFELSGEELDISSVLYKLVINKDSLDDSLIMSASIIYTLVENDDVKSSLTIPDRYIEAGKEQALLDYNSSNVWKTELPRFIDALDEILGISSGDDFVFDGDSISESLSEFLSQLKIPSRVNPEFTKLELCYYSDIIWGEITVRLDETLLSIVPEEALVDAKSRGYYKLEEVQALADALDIFGIHDLFTSGSAGGDDIVEKVKAMIFTLNDPREDYDNQTALEVIYRSNIIKYIFSGEIDKALADAVDEVVITQIKGGRKTYPQQDIADFIDAAREIDITDFDSLTNFDFAEMGDITSSSHLHPDSGETRLDVIYASRIAAGVITKSLYNALNSDNTSGVRVDHSKAYEQNIRIYKQSEVESIFDVFGQLEDFDIEKVNLKKVSESLYDEFGNTHSYLIAAVISKVFVDNENFIIPVDVLDDEGCILPRESALIISVFGDLSEGQDLEDLENWEIDEIPGGETRKNLFASGIMRARITYDLGIESNESGKPVFVSPDCVKITKDTKGATILIISEEELNALAAALDNIQRSDDESAFSIHITFNELASYDEKTLKLMLESDIMYYTICECLLENSAVQLYLLRNNITPDRVEAINLYTGKTENRTVISKATIQEFFAQN